MFSHAKYSFCAVVLGGITLSGITVHASPVPLSKSEVKTYASALAEAAKGNAK